MQSPSSLKDSLVEQLGDNIPSTYVVSTVAPGDVRRSPHHASLTDLAPIRPNVLG